MQFTFDAEQAYQLEAVEAVCGLLEGQPNNGVGGAFSPEGGFVASPNRLDLTEVSLLANLTRVQAEQGIAPDQSLQFVEVGQDADEGARFPNFSVEMETGTGKTYVYLRTALELSRRYGFRKFVVVVPSVAIREGVLKDLDMTKEHFGELYRDVPYRWSVYDSAKLGVIRQFALSDGLEFLVMTIDSFTKESNVIRQSTDRFQGETPIRLVQATRPILILDEPQNMESELRIQALSALEPIVALRYSATHRNPYNLVYRLTPFDAYRLGLVKRIEVASVVRVDDVNQPFIRVHRIDSKKKKISARLAVHKLMRTGIVKEKDVTVLPEDKLTDKTSRNEYEGYEVAEINPGGQFVRFANNVEVAVGGAVGADRDAIFEAQIKYTVEEHFRKQERLRAAGVKVLSLFFVDRVDDYASDDGIVRRLFEAAFEHLKSSYEEWRNRSVEEVAAAYFAQKTKKGREVVFVESSGGQTKEDAAAYDLIMRNKERLLSFDEPASFIFSHSALKEGWDNPNVFQICTLRQSGSDNRRRQEVGRGIRLCRDQTGERLFDERLNVLTVVANESYEGYVSGLQTQIEKEDGADAVPPPPPNARTRKVAKLKKEFVAKPEFTELWDRIREKTRYNVRVDTDALLAEAIPKIDRITVKPPRVAVTKAQVQVSNEDVFEALQLSSAKTLVDLVGRYPLPNTVELMADLMEHTSPTIRVSRRTLLEVLRRTINKGALLENPHDFAAEAVRLLKESLVEHVVGGIKYTKSGEWFEMSQLETEFESWESYLVPAPHSLYDHVSAQSGVERTFVEELENRKDVVLYLKLPAWFKVPTPVGEYNPDWAIVMQEVDEHGDPVGDRRLYLVRETKSANWKTSLRPSERMKVTCGEEHFRNGLGVDYKVVSSARDLP